MRALNYKRQRGYVLILTLLAFMGVGGVVLANFTKEARRDLDTRKYEHNQRVLAEAKRALLMYAYNYPADNPGRGPGRLPCPDTDDDGAPNPSLNCINGVAILGRFPWNDPDMDFYDARDASGERLWYVVSSNFANTKPAGTDVINSDTTGTITLYDNAGRLLYDGSVAGVAAVIIAPGTRLRRDNDGDGVVDAQQVRTPGNENNPQNYLDTFTPALNVRYDNSFFVNGSIADVRDGLIHGPVIGPQNEILVNDQMIIVTAEEVIEMAEKAVIETYRDAIDGYLEQFWGTPAVNYRYPWLAAYAVTSDLDIYDPQPPPGFGATSGRVPFLNHYTDDDTHTVITDLQVDFDITLNYTSMVDNASPLDPGYPGVVDGTYVDESNTFSGLFTGFPGGTQTVTTTRSNLSFSRLEFDGTDGTDPGTMVVRDGGTATVTLTPSIEVTRYFWDEQGGAADGWELCPVVSGWVTDCAMDNGLTAFEPFTDWNNHGDVRIRKLRLRLTVDPDFEVELAYATAPTPVPTIAAPTAPTATANARFVATFNAVDVPDLSVADAVETNVRNLIDLEVVLCDQDNNVGSNFNIDSWAEEPGGSAQPPDSGTVTCSVDLAPNVTATLNNQFVVTADWYPQLPRWVETNGWDNAVMMSFMPDFAPGGDGNCTPDADPFTPAADDCLVVSNQGGVNNDIEAVLVLAGEHDLVDGNDFNADGDELDANEALNNSFADELHDIFETENFSGIGVYFAPTPLYPNPNNDPTPASDTSEARVFDKREELIPGNANDTVYVIN